MQVCVLSAGGTGGHVFPAEALANELLARGHRLALITDKRGADYGGTLGRIDRHAGRAPVLGSVGERLRLEYFRLDDGLRRIMRESV